MGVENKTMGEMKHGKTLDCSDKKVNVQSAQMDKLILFEGNVYTKKELDALLKARQISKRITARRMRNQKAVIFLSNPK